VRRGWPRRRIATSAALLFVTLAVSGCGPQSPLDPQSEAARQIALLWWVMLAVSVLVFAGACFLLGLSWFRRHRSGLPIFGERERLFDASVVVFGIAIPIVALVALFFWANVAVVEHTDAPRAGATPMTVQVSGHQWWWEVNYPGTGAVTANEIHIPAGTPVTILTESEDVIHSFWIPQLNRKVDSLPGHPNRVELFAERPGRYRGQCAEFCGQQHAHMGVSVIAQPPAEFRAWLANMARPRPEPATSLARRGEQVFLSHECASCHSIRGTPARGDVGPDLTHLATRETLAALTIPNRKGYLAGWILDPQTVKEGAKMPSLNLSGPDLQALLEYLQGLR
jgi:cytochrome c oxidase subunit 2